MRPKSKILQITYNTNTRSRFYAPPLFEDFQAIVYKYTNRQMYKLKVLAKCEDEDVIMFDEDSYSRILLEPAQRVKVEVTDALNPWETAIDQLQD